MLGKFQDIDILEAGEPGNLKSALTNGLNLVLQYILRHENRTGHEVPRGSRQHVLQRFIQSAVTGQIVLAIFIRSEVEGG